MKTQPQWPRFAALESPLDGESDARERQAELKADVREAKARVREMLESLTRKYDIPANDVSYAIDGFADDMLAELIFGVERDLEQAVDEQASAAFEGAS